MHQTLPQTQLPQCGVCKQDPVPQSTQHVLLLILQVGMLFVNWKLSIIFLMMGYSFPKTVWKCSFCSREIQNVDSNQNNISDNIILRMGNCMALFSLQKFRIFAAVVCVAMIYLFATEPRFINPKSTVKKTWQALLQNSGYQMYIENSVRANHIYSLYLDSGFDWELQGIFLSRQPSGVTTFQDLFIKMNPTQFKDPQAYDFKIFTKLALGVNLQKGDLIQIKGQWEGRQYHNLIFNPIQIKKTGKNVDPSSVNYFYQKNSMLRSHLDSVRPEYDANQQIQDESKIKMLKQNKLPAQSPNQVKN